MAKSTRRDPFARSGFEGKDPLDLIPVAKKAVRQRTWEKKNKTFSYRIPQRLQAEAIEVRESILSIAAYDEKGHLRMDQTTVDDVAKNLVAYALVKAKKENLTFSPTRQGKMKLEWEEAEQDWSPPIVLKKVEKKKRQTPVKQMFLGYRWSLEHHAEIEVLAGSTKDVHYRDDGSIVNNPHRFSVSPGEVIVRLLQRAITAYKERRLLLSSQPETVSQKVTGWVER
jgi:hypothetical protein